MIINQKVRSFLSNLLDNKDTIIVFGDIGSAELKEIADRVKFVIVIYYSFRCYNHCSGRIDVRNIEHISMHPNKGNLTALSIRTMCSEIFRYKYKCLLVTTYYILNNLNLNEMNNKPLILYSESINLLYVPINKYYDINGKYIVKSTGKKIEIRLNRVMGEDKQTIRAYLYGTVLYIINIKTLELGFYYNNAIIWYNGEIWY